MSDAQSIRPFLRHLEDHGALLRVGKPVDPVYEMSAFLSAADAGPALLFENVAGSPLRAVGNVLNSRARIADALGVTLAGIVPAIHAAIRGPVAPVRVAAGRVQGVTRLDAPLADLPVPTFFVREGRPYITAGVIIARDPETGRGNASFARLGVIDGSTAMIGIAPNHHLAVLARRAARPLEIAVVIGAHPAIQLAACLYLGLGVDELACAGRLLGRPVDVVAAKTVDLHVPADAELVLEGTIDPAVPIAEGLVSEYHGMYEGYGPGWLARFSAITRREDAIFQVIQPGYHREHIYLGAMPIAASLLNAVAAVVPNVRDVAVTEAGGRADGRGGADRRAAAGPGAAGDVRRVGGREPGANA